MRIKRQGLIVWFQHMKNIKQIKRYGHLISVSRKLRYAVVYVDQDKVKEKANQLERLPFVSRVDFSYKPFIKREFDQAKDDEAKEYDYKVGI